MTDPTNQQEHDMTTDLHEAFVAAVERLLPGHTTTLSAVTWEPLTAPEPCERCGTLVVCILWNEQPGWFEITADGIRDAYCVVDGENRSILRPHAPRRCTAAKLKSLPNESSTP